MTEKNHNMCALVLSAGKGTRMKSPIPKVLHLLLGEHMLWYVYQGLGQIFHKQDILYVLGYKADLIEKSVDFIGQNTIYQNQQLGTGHALQCAYPELVKRGYEWCLVVNGDVPLLDIGRLESLINEVYAQRALMGLMTITLEDPTGYGRIVRDDFGNLKSIIEEKDIEDPRVRDIKEVNAGIYFLNLNNIEDYLFKLTNNNKQGEYYLPQLVELFLKDQRSVLAINAGEDKSFLGINSSRELIECEEILRQRIVEQLFDKGVIIYNPYQVRIGPRVEIDPGVRLTGPVEIYGNTKIRANVVIDSNVWISDSHIGCGSRVFSFSHIEGAYIGEANNIGPFARIRPGTQLDKDVKIGNFVEVKKSKLERGVKASHLSYLGDSFVGEHTNVGAGTITCNYDGKNKHKTYIGKSVFIGSNTSLVAPISIGDNALIGAGSTITKDVPQGALSVARGKQKNLNKKNKP